MVVTNFHVTVYFFGIISNVMLNKNAINTMQREMVQLEEEENR